MSEPNPNSVDRAFGKWVLAFWQPTGVTARVALALAAGASCLLFVWICGIFNLPSIPGLDGSLFHQPSFVSAFLIVAVLLFATTLVGTVFAGSIHFEAGLFAAAFGLMTVSERCGTIQSVLFEAGGNDSVYFGLIAELVILGALLAGAWFMLKRIDVALHGPEPAKPADKSSALHNLTALIAQTAVTAAGVMILCQSEAKNQCLASVAIASLLGTILAHKYAPTRPSIWYWMGPLLVGIIGYSIAATGFDDRLSIGSPTGLFAPLARPLPLDYASLGVAGAIFGYWMAHKARAGEAS